jgi:hypothetical protein
MSRKQMWLPTTETKVTVDQAGNVNVWDEMTMQLRPVPHTGFIGKEAGAHEPHDHRTMVTPPPIHPQT